MYRCTICHTIAHAMPTHDATRAAAGQNERRLQAAAAPPHVHRMLSAFGEGMLPPPGEREGEREREGKARL